MNPFFNYNPFLISVALTNTNQSMFMVNNNNHFLNQNLNHQQISCSSTPMEIDGEEQVKEDKEIIEVSDSEDSTTYSDSDSDYESETTTKTQKKVKPIKEISKAPKKKNISLVMKKKVWERYIGLEIGQQKCKICNITDIYQMSFSCGHVLAEKNGGETNIENLRPICVSCNSSMGTENMRDFYQKNRVQNISFDRLWK